MDDPPIIPETTPPEKSAEPGSEPAGAKPAPAGEAYPILSGLSAQSAFPQTLSPQAGVANVMAGHEVTVQTDAAEQTRVQGASLEAEDARRRAFRHNLLLLLS